VVQKTLDEDIEEAQDYLDENDQAHQEDGHPKSGPRQFLFHPVHLGIILEND